MNNAFNRYQWDVVMGSLTPMSGAIAVGTRKFSTWIKVAGLESFTVNLAASGTVNGTWGIQGSQSDDVIKAADAITDITTFPQAPVYPTGVAGAGDVVQGVYGYRYVRFYFDPAAGAGNAVVTFKGVMTGAPIDVAQLHYGSFHLFVAAADTLAGQFAVEGSNNWSGILQGTKVGNGPFADGKWTNYLPSPAIAVLVASTGQDRLVRLGVSTDGADGVIETGAVRVKFTWTGGFGSPLVSGAFKGT